MGAASLAVLLRLSPPAVSSQSRGLLWAGHGPTERAQSPIGGRGAHGGEMEATDVLTRSPPAPHALPGFAKGGCAPPRAFDPLTALLLRGVCLSSPGRVGTSASRPGGAADTSGVWYLEKRTGASPQAELQGHHAVFVRSGRTPLGWSVADPWGTPTHFSFEGWAFCF